MRSGLFCLIVIDFNSLLRLRLCSIGRSILCRHSMSLAWQRHPGGDHQNNYTNEKVCQNITNTKSKNIQYIYQIYPIDPKHIQDMQDKKKISRRNRPGPGRAGCRLVFCTYLAYLGYILDIFGYIFGMCLIIFGTFLGQRT